MPPIISPPRIPTSVTPPPVIERKKSQVARALIWAGILLAVVVVSFIGLRVVQFIQWARQPHAPTRQSYLYAATANLGPMGPVASGNSEDAQAIAAVMSRRMMMFRTIGYTQSEQKGVLDEKDRFRTYCDLRENQCVFLVHVPELRRFTQDAQAALGRDAWAAACSILQEKEIWKPGMKLAVGMRGLITYERVMLGSYLDKDNSPDKGMTDVKEGVGCEKVLAEWLAPPLDSQVKSPQ